MMRLSSHHLALAPFDQRTQVVRPEDQRNANLALILRVIVNARHTRLVAADVG